MRFPLLILHCFLLSFASLPAQTWTVFDSSNSGLTHNHCTRLYRDSNDVLWIGTLGGGLNSYDGSFWQVQATSNSFIPGDSIFALAPDKQGFLWAGTEGGLGWRFGVGIWNVYDSLNSPLPENKIRSILADPAGDIWAGTSQGIAWLDNPNWTLFNKSNSGMRGNLHYGINLVDRDGVLWAATLDGGIGLYQSGVWRNYDTGNSGLPVNAIQVVFQDFFDEKWIGTRGGGLVNFARLLWTVLDTNNSDIPGMTINCIKEELPGRLWIGFEGQGLALYENEQWTVYNSGNSGLPNDTINDIWIDKGQGLWVATPGGLARSATLISRENPQIQPQLQLSPNPTRSQLRVEIGQAPLTNGHLEIWDLYGHMLRKSPKIPAGQKSAQIDVSGLTEGIYLLKWGSQIQRFVKN